MKDGRNTGRNDGLRFSLKDHEETLHLALEDQGEFRLYPRGSSMLPLLREGIDSVILEAPSQPVRRGQILLVRTRRGGYLLHRVRSLKAGVLTLRGDNNLSEERLEPGWTALASVRAISRNERRIPMDSPLFILYACFLPLHRLKLRLGYWRRREEWRG